MRAAARTPAPAPVREQHSRELVGSGRPTITPTTWEPHATISFREWIEHGRRLGWMGRGIGWWIGDWLRFGNAAYGERYAPAALATGYDRQSLMNMVYVASSVEPKRRHGKLSFSHHAEIAALEPAEQDRWLERAERDRLSVRCLREAIRCESRGATAERRTAARRAARRDEAPVVCPSCGHAIGAGQDGTVTLKEIPAMPSDDDKPTAELPHSDASRVRDSDSTEDALGAMSHLTHAERVVLVDEYLKTAASSGVWSAIE